MKLETILKPVKKTLVTLGLVSLLGATALTVNYFATHKDKVKAEETSAGINYSHPDEQTTHILNYIAGKEAMTRDERADIMKDVLKRWCHANEVEIPELKGKSEREVAEWFVDNYKVEGKDYIRDVNATLKHFEKIIPLRKEWNPKLYDTLWRLEGGYGSPKIDWALWVNGENKSVLSFFSEDKVTSPSYRPFSNKIMVYPNDPLETLMSEFPHAKQFNTDLINIGLKLTDTAKRIGQEIIKGTSVIEAYQKEYSILGSVEFEAHRVIEPKLKQRLKE